MANNYSVLQILEKAISQDESQHLEFVRRIPEILAACPQNWIISKFLPFFVNWMPKNNEKILSAIIQYVPQIVAKVGSIDNIVQLVEAILMSDNQEIEKQLIPQLLQFEKDPSCFQFINELVKSQYDCVRSFVPLIIDLAGDDDAKREILPPLAYDPSFRVRKASLKIIESTPNEELACQIAYTFINDTHARIRAYIPIVSTNRPFYTIHILKKLQNDLDWSVRASIARELPKCAETELAIQSCLSLTADKVWQVRYLALKSLIALLPSSKLTAIDQDFYSTLIDTIKFPQPLLKKIVIDFFLNFVTKASTFSDIIIDQDSETKMYFIAKAIQSKKLKIIIHNANSTDKSTGLIIELVKDIMKSENWSTRKAIADVFIDIAKTVQTQQIIKQLTELCLILLKDEALPVRESAVIQLAAFTPIDNIDQNFPQFLIELEESDYFRDRQTAINLLHALSMKASSQSKEFLILRIRKFLKDSVSNVVEYASYILNLEN